jgi:hypothetical protein
VVNLNMKTKPAMEKVSTDDAAENFERMIEEAVKKPGVAELFRVYESWQMFDQVSRITSQFTGTQYMVSASTSSGPMLHQLG